MADMDFRCGVCGHPLQWPPAATDVDRIKCSRCGVDAGSLGSLKVMAADFVSRADRRAKRPDAKPRG